MVFALFVNIPQTCYVCIHTCYVFVLLVFFFCFLFLLFFPVDEGPSPCLVVVFSVDGGPSSMFGGVIF